MKAAILETEKTTDIILKLFQPATQKESKAVSLFLLTISLLSSFLTLCIKVRESSWPQLQSSTSKGRGGGGLPEHFRMEYTIVLPTSSFITIFLVSPFGRGFCFNFLDPCIQPRSRKKIISWYLPHHSHLQLYCGCNRLIHSTKKSFLETCFL